MYLLSHTFPSCAACLPRQRHTKAASSCHCSNPRDPKCIFGKHRQVTPQGGWFFCLLLASYFRKWYLSAPELGCQKAASCSEPPCAHSSQVSIQEVRSVSALDSVQKHTALSLPRLTQRLYPKAILCNSTMWMCTLDRFLLQTASSADC